MSIRSRIAAKLRPFVERWAPIAPVIGPGQTRYRVIAVRGGTDEVLYDGVNGADARRWWEYYHSAGTLSLQFWQNDTLRDQTPR